MRHVTWAVTWMLVGLAVTLATASVIQQKALTRVASQHPAPIAMPDTAPPLDNAKPKTDEPMRSVVVASRHRRDLIN